ncbi:hypothetical protein [Cellulomonas wangsupingiae]|uniref:Translation initiation factor IF-2 n=1 Tax=Cellulomonas wangsupingiae TaxID=2968085 RepID=A0ABY5K7A0_9CELL|nr:hypothetical protein [Cellulomonas wangsupingiae]MCC2334710.1 hypothetical protein [Cellulomonas wangsupingiae]MCM0638569.1 hypothetical protein [Cellulomonas wangsupingiae]UUI66332.1 hypothetical protein NP075_06350 [Cellulomonas wangsupingiae]
MEDTSKKRPAGAAATPGTTPAATEQPTVAQPTVPVTESAPAGHPVEPTVKERKGRSLSVLATSLIGGGALVLGLALGGGAVALATHDGHGDGHGMHQEGPRGGAPQDEFGGQRPGGPGDRGPSGGLDEGGSEGRTHTRPDERSDAPAEERSGRSSRERGPQDGPSDGSSQEATPEQEPSGQA